MLKVGTKAPDFEALTTGSRKISLSKNYKGKFVVIIFYCKNNTPGCNRQLSACRDDLSQFNKITTEVLAVNPASVDSHEKYAKQFNFNFPLISDIDKKICAAYDVLDEGKVVRTVYIINPDGYVIYAKKGLPENQELLKTIEEYKKENKKSQFKI